MIKNLAKDLNRLLNKEDIQMASKDIKRCSMSYVNKEMQIKATLWYHCTPIRMVKIQNTDNTKCWQGCAATKTHSWLVEMRNVAATLEDSLAVSYKTKHTFTIWSSNHTPWYFPKGVGSMSIQKTCTWMFIVALFIIAKPWKQPRGSSVGEQINNCLCNIVEWYN